MYITAKAVEEVLLILESKGEIEVEERQQGIGCCTALKHGFGDWDYTKANLLRMDKGEFIVEQVEKFCTEKPQVDVIHEQLTLFER